MSVATLSDASAASGFASLAIGAIRDIRWPQVRAAMLLGLALTVWSFIVFMQPIILYAQSIPFGLMVLQTAIADQAKALCLLVAIVIADRAVDAGARRRRAYLLAALAGCLAGIVVTEPFTWAWRTYMLPDLWPAKRAWLHGTRALIYHPIFALTHWLLVGSAVVFLYADRRAARKTAQLLRDAELDRIRRSKLAIESRLQAMQARVEPQFLFNTLAQVERLYETEPKLAGRMLDDLIAYLRAAMPLMRDTASTVGQEIDLVRAYLDIARIRLGDRLAVQIDAPPGIRGLRMPPMMLLPLVDHAIVYGLDESTDGGSIRIGAAVHEGKLRLLIDDRGAGLLAERQAAGIDAIRQRLKALYGDAARLEVRQVTAGGTQAALEVPVEVSVPASFEDEASAGV
jgi:hypothetical protein